MRPNLVLPFNEVLSLIGVSEALVARRWYLMAQHKVLGPFLVRLDLGSLFSGAKAANTGLLQDVHQPIGQRVLRANDNQVDLILQTPARDSLR